MIKMGSRIVDRGKKIITFRVFAYDKKQMSTVIKTPSSESKVFPMQEESPCIYTVTIEGQGLDLLYKFRIDEEGDFPDPYSNFQPFGVHGFSQVIDHSAFEWHDQSFEGTDFEKYIIMEIHPGTFTSEGTFRAAAEKIDYLIKLGITAVEIMPVSQTPGSWNWGYDGVNLFSVNHNYGTPDDLKYFIDCCHQKQIAVILDVVYNHFGPEGNYLPVYGPYFTEKHQTPWGAAVNYDDTCSGFVREMVLENVHYWLEVFHFDGLRLDAVHAIKDDSTVHILQEIKTTVKNSAKRLGCKKFVMAESDENNVRLITPVTEDGYGMDAQWMDDFHHVIHTALTGENKGYYMDYGRLTDLEKVYKNYLYTGQYSNYWKKKRGTDGSERPGCQFIVCIQNHDQVGNRANGDRLAALVELPYLKAAAGLMFFSAYIPLLFMGEEYGEKKPFLFFTDYQDPQLRKAVSQGRREEFKLFGWTEVPDPQNPETFYRSKLTPRENWEEQNQQLFCFYRDLIKLRLSHPVLTSLNNDTLKIKVTPKNQLIEITRWNKDTKLVGLFNLGNGKIEPGSYCGNPIFNSEWKTYGGSVEKEENKEKQNIILQKGQMLILQDKSNN